MRAVVSCWELRSGRFYHTIPQEREDPINPYQASLPPPTSMTQQPSHIIPVPIRVTPTQISTRQVSGSDADHTARQFLDLCEAAIVNSSITEDHDKIAFIRSRLLPGSRTLIMMQSSAFTHTNYDAFKKNVIKIFLEGNKTSIVKQVPHTVETLKNTSTKPIWDNNNNNNNNNTLLLLQRICLVLVCYQLHLQSRHTKNIKHKI